jgi:predicted nucleic acid-binding protein
MVRLIEEGCVELIGPVRHEVLSGVRTESQFDSLREALDLFPEIEIRSEDYVEAARLYNLCRSKGIQGAGTDFVLCAVAIREEVPVFTVDGDFERYAQVFPLPLHKVDSHQA